MRTEISTGQLYDHREVSSLLPMESGPLDLRLVSRVYLSRLGCIGERAPLPNLQPRFDQLPGPLRLRQTHLAGVPRWLLQARSKHTPEHLQVLQPRASKR